MGWLAHAASAIGFCLAGCVAAPDDDDVAANDDDAADDDDATPYDDGLDCDWEFGPWELAGELPNGRSAMAHTLDGDRLILSGGVSWGTDAEDAFGGRNAVVAASLAGGALGEWQVLGTGPTESPHHPGIFEAGGRLYQLDEGGAWSAPLTNTSVGDWVSEEAPAVGTAPGVVGLAPGAVVVGDAAGANLATRANEVWLTEPGPTTLGWSQLPLPPERRTYVTVAAAGPEVLVLGGYQSDEEEQPATDWSYDLTRPGWQERAIPSGSWRYSVSAAALPGSDASGWGFIRAAGLEYIDRFDDVWATCRRDAPHEYVQLPDLPSARQGAILVVQGEFVWLLGGEARREDGSNHTPAEVYRLRASPSF